MTDLKELPKGNTTIQWQLETLQVAATNLSTVATVFAIWGTLFAVVFFIFGVTYKTSAGNNESINLFYFIVLNFVEPFCFQISQFIIIYNATRPTQHNAQFGQTFSVLKSPNHLAPLFARITSSRNSRISNSRNSRISSSKNSRISNSRISNLKLEQEIRSSMTRPVSTVPKAYLLSPPGNRSSSTSLTSSRSWRISSSKIDQEIRSSMTSVSYFSNMTSISTVQDSTRPEFTVPKTHLLSPSGNHFSVTSSRSISSTVSKTIVELNNVSSSNTVSESVHSRNHLSENLDMISNASTSFYSIRESLIASSRNNSFIDSNSKQINSQKPSSQFSGHGFSINEHLNNANLSLQKSQRSSNSNLSIPLN
ncbi:hypothetical protein F8M41_010200 [Gigaspora margarita]|uniref:Uncharacterized protein n=1 Tax=Gigaspora margarita TaxID=4874 RepID=A0A8H3X1X4_GIGMA|nr:hypothetical protein F8M41_010200 [Gigaspora margarita]